MGMTLRQFQKLLYKSKQPGFQGKSDRDLAKFAELLCNQHGGWGQAVVKAGELHGACTCPTCRTEGRRTSDLTSFVDSLCRKYGADMDATQALAKWLRCEKPAQQDGGQGGSQQQEQSSDGSESSEPQAGDGAGQGQGSVEPRPQAQPQPLSADDLQALDDWQEQQAQEAGEEQRVERRRQADEERREAYNREQRRQAAAAAKAAAAALKAARQQKNRAAAKAAQAALAAAKRQLGPRTGAPSGPPIPGSPSRAAMRQIAGATARLRRVSPKLRQQLAELINKLVATSGTAGEEFAPVPMIDSRKLVKRMLVRRPLANALKEDVQRGRPVTLFLPDISPSCAAQAQDSCDIANAAGYAGVAGSDVLVLPHSNGCVESGDAYTPWFNGKPAPMDKLQFAELLDRVIKGTSRYRVRVVVAIGDHDAEEMYEEILGVRQVTKLIWLHNDTDGNGGRAALASGRSRPRWASDKLRLVYGCINAKEMLRGLKLSLT
jgi:hypothetical protein